MSTASVDNHGLYGLKKQESGRCPPSISAPFVDPPKSHSRISSLLLELECNKKLSGRKSE